MAAETYAAVDLGAESGRVVVGQLAGKQLSLREVHRFKSTPVWVNGHLHWDALRLYDEVQNGLTAAVKSGGELRSLGVDTWGVDFGLLDRTGTLLGNPYHYRDHRTDGVVEALFKVVPAEQVFGATGTQIMQINSLYQLYAMVQQRSPVLEVADRYLMMPDLFHYWLCGEKVVEYSIASTSQCYDVARKAWATALMERLGIPTRIFPQVVQPGTRLGGLLPSVAERIGRQGVQVVAPACHDTASAVAAVPTRTARFAYISSGTWSLMGAVSPQPVMGETVRALGFTNEGGVAGSVRLLRNIVGLWLVQECRRTWARAGEELGYDALAAMATSARPFQAVIDPNDQCFNTPEDMPRAIQEYCARTGQAPPTAKGDLLRVILESLAWEYRRNLHDLERLLGHKLEALHIVGGGSQNQLLCQLAADATGLPVLAGPVEATAIGNLLAQLIAAGACASWEEAREIVRATFPLTTYQPSNTAAWDEASPRVKTTLEKARRPC
jgi:rhamnulokinase